MTNGKGLQETIAVTCPNCQQPVKQRGREIICVNCDAVFDIKEKRGATVKKIGPLDELSQRVTNCEAKLGIEVGGSDQAPDQDQTPDQDQAPDQDQDQAPDQDQTPEPISGNGIAGDTNTDEDILGPR